MPRPRSLDLTGVHRRVLGAVARCVEEFGSASLPDLVAELGLAGVTSLAPTLKVIERNGFVEVLGGGKRGRRRWVILTERGKAALGLGGLKVLGEIPAGPLAEAVQRCDSFINNRDLLPHRHNDFLLLVRGDSMVGDGILPGDKVLLRPNVQVQNGEIAAVHVGDEFLATLKHVHFEPGRNRITLKASNPDYEDVIAPASDVRVAGVFRGLIRIP